MCVVFAETEIVGLLASGVLPEDILAGVETAIATRIASMAGRALVSPVLFTGGVAMVPGMGPALARCWVIRCGLPHSRSVPARWGRALLAAQRAGQLPPGRT